MTGLELKLLRKKMKYTRKMLADELKMSENYIYLLESGRKPIGQRLENTLKRLEKTIELKSNKTNKDRIDADPAECIECEFKKLTIAGLMDNIAILNRLVEKLTDSNFSMRTELKEIQELCHDKKN